MSTARSDDAAVVQALEFLNGQEFSTRVTSGKLLAELSQKRGPARIVERATGDSLIIDSEKQYGFHGHFSSGNSLLFFGGGFKRGFVYGKTADAHPMLPIEHSVRLEDVHATIYQALGIPANTSYVVEGRPFYVTKDGTGSVLPGDQRRQLNECVVVAVLADPGEQFVGDIPAGDRHAVGVLQEGALPLVVARAGRVVG